MPSRAFWEARSRAPGEWADQSVVCTFRGRVPSQPSSEAADPPGLEGVGRHQDGVCVLSLSFVSSSDTMDCSPPGASVHGVLQARTRVGCHFLLQEVPISPTPQQGLNPHLSSALAGGFFTTRATWEAPFTARWSQFLIHVPTAVSLPGESCGQRSLAGSIGSQSQTRVSQLACRGHEILWEGTRTQSPVEPRTTAERRPLIRSDPALRGLGLLSGWFAPPRVGAAIGLVCSAPRGAGGGYTGWQRGRARLSRPCSASGLSCLWREAAGGVPSASHPGPLSLPLCWGGGVLCLISGGPCGWENQRKGPDNGCQP